MFSLTNTLLLFAGLINVAVGTHWRYGQISWKLVPGTTYQVEFLAEIGWRTTFIGSNYFNYGDGNRILMRNTECTAGVTPCVAQDTSSNLYYERLSDSTDIAGELATLIRYIFYYTYSSTGPFTYNLNSCCRVSSLIAGGDDRFILNGEVDMTGGNTGSPVSSISPILQFELSQVNTFALVPVDNDGDTVTCRQATSSESGINENPTTYFSVNTANCEVTISVGGSVGDKYAAQVFMETSRGDSIPLDFIFEAIPATLDPPECTVISTPSPSGVFEIQANNMLLVDLFADDPDSSSTDTINIIATSLPTGAVVDPVGVTTLGSGVAIEFEWIPTNSQAGSFSASVQIVDSDLFTASCTIPILVTEIDTLAPTNYPSQEPSFRPSDEPSFRPSAEPTFRPSAVPTEYPTPPTLSPTVEPSEEPTEEPRRFNN